MTYPISTKEYNGLPFDFERTLKAHVQKESDKWWCQEDIDFPIDTLKIPRRMFTVYNFMKLLKEVIV